MDRLVVEVLGFLVDDVHAVESPFEAEVGADNAHVARHDGLHFFQALGNQDHFLVEHHAFIVPVRHFLAEIDMGYLADGVLGSAVGEYQGFQQGVRCQAVGTVQAGAGAFAGSVQVLDAGAGVAVHHDAAAAVMRHRDYRQQVFGDVDADGEAFGVNSGEMVEDLFFGDRAAIQEHMVVAGDFHFVVDSAGYHIAGSQFQTRVVAVHEVVAPDGAEFGACASYGFRNQEAGLLAGIVEAGRMELDEFHVRDLAFGPVNHRHAVAGGYYRVGGVGVDVAVAAGGQHRGLGQDGLYFIGIGVEYVGSETFDVGRAAGHFHAEVVLGNQVYREIAFQEFDVGVFADGFQQGAFYFGSGLVLVVQDAVRGMPAFPA